MIFQEFKVFAKIPMFKTLKRCVLPVEANQTNRIEDCSVEPP